MNRHLQYQIAAELIQGFLLDVIPMPQGVKPASASPSTQFVPNASARAMLVQVTAFDQGAEVLLERVATGARQLDHIAHRDAPVFPGKFDNLQSQFRQRRKNQLFSLDLLLQSAYLLSQRPKEKREPRLPVWIFRAN